MKEVRLPKMTRKKVTLAYIINDSERKASFKKRKRGLIKKVSELSTLCGVDACAIIYSPYEPEPEVWPSVLGAQAILARFRKLSEIDQCRKMVNQETFTKQRIKKASEQYRRLHKENKCRELECYMYHCIRGVSSIDAFQISYSSEMSWVITQTLRDITSRMEVVAAAEKRRRLAAVPLRVQQRPLPLRMAPSPLPLPPPPPPPPVVEEEALRFDEEEGMECFPWNLVQSPTGGGAGAMEGGGLGWDTGMVLPFPYIFNH